MSSSAGNNPNTTPSLGSRTVTRDGMNREDSSIMPPPTNTTTVALGNELEVAWLDQYLVRILVSNFCDSLSDLFWKDGGSRRPNMTDQQQQQRTLQWVRIWLLAALQSMTLWSTQCQTPAVKAVGLQVVHPKNKASSTTLWYIVLSVLCPSLYQQLRSYLNQLQEQQASYSQQQQENIATTHQIGQERQQQVIHNILKLVDDILPWVRLGLLLSLLRKDQRHSPRLSMLLAGLSFQRCRPNPSSNSGLHVLYAHRRWIYEEALRTLKLVFGSLMVDAPHQIRDVHKFYQDYLSFPFQRRCMLLHRWLQTRYGLSLFSSHSINSACPLCQKSPIGIPYITNCGHLYCYTCLWKATQQNPTNYVCRVCHETITSSRPMTGQEDGIRTSSTAIMSSSIESPRSQ